MIADLFPGRSAKTNAYNGLLCDALEDAGVQVREFAFAAPLRGPKADILHVHWPEYSLSERRTLYCALRLLKFFTAMFLYRLRGSKIVWTAHNLRPHERLHPTLEPAFYRLWFRLVAGITCLSQSSKEALLNRYPGLATRPTAVIPHGSYLPVLQSPLDRGAARSFCDLPQHGTILSSLGAIRKYKNIPLLIQIFRSLNLADTSLVIAGKSRDPELVAEINDAIDGDGRVIFRNQFLSDEELQRYNEASDLIVLPYSDILNSGSALYSLSCSRPILVPNLGSLSELQEAVGTDWVCLYEPPFSGDALKKAVDQVMVGTVPNLSEFDWARIGEQTRNFYQSILGVQ